MIRVKIARMKSGILAPRSYDIIKGKSMRPTLIKLRGAKIPLFLLAILTLILIVIVPLVMIVLVSFLKAYGLPLEFKNFTFAQYEKVFTANGQSHIRQAQRSGQLSQHHCCG